MTRFCLLVSIVAINGALGSAVLTDVASAAAPTDCGQAAMTVSCGAGGGGGGSNLVAPGGTQSLASTGHPMGQTPYTRPHPTKIYRVRFRGDARDPEIVIYGDDFGDRPTAEPSRTTSYFGNCGPVPGRTGRDYGSELWISDRTQLWSAGNTLLGDCMGLSVKHYSDDEIVYRLGSFYTDYYQRRTGFTRGIYELASHDHVWIAVKGTLFRTCVHYDEERRAHRH